MKDARGADIKDGDTVVYGFGVGRSVAMAEGIFTGEVSPSGRLWIEIVRRSYGGGYLDSKSRVHVAADRLVVVTGLPPTDMPTQAEKMATDRAVAIRRYRQVIARLEADGADPGEIEWYQKRLKGLEK